MASRKLAVLAPLLVLAVASVSRSVAAQAPEPESGTFAVAHLDTAFLIVNARGNEAKASISLSDGTFVEAPFVGQFTVDHALSSALISGTVGTVAVDVRLTGQGNPTNTALGQVKKHEDCSATLAHEIHREASAFGTINGEAVEGAGYFGRYFYPPGGASPC